MVIHPNLETVHCFFLGAVFLVVSVRPTAEHQQRGSETFIAVAYLQGPKVDRCRNGLYNHKERKRFIEHHGGGDDVDATLRCKAEFVMPCRICVAWVCDEGFRRQRLHRTEFSRDVAKSSAIVRSVSLRLIRPYKIATVGSEIIIVYIRDRDNRHLSSFA
jgi:hypothetical protein